MWREFNRLENIAAAARHDFSDGYAELIRQFNAIYREALQKEDLQRQKSAQDYARERHLHQSDIDNWSIRCSALVTWVNFLRRHGLPEGTGSQ